MLQPLFEVRRYRGDVVTHSHDYHQVVLPLEGRLSMVVSGTEGYVDAHLEWPLTVADMARIGNVSASRLHALFREHLMTTPQKYLTQRRLRRASELLAHTSLSVMEVAMRVGYGDQAAFTRAFRKHTGRAPLSYRTAASSQQDEHKSQ
jgi:transcriptional regulator GlxA family with amidase domain